VQDTLNSGCRETARAPSIYCLNIFFHNELMMVNNDTGTTRKCHQSGPSVKCCKPSRVVDRSASSATGDGRTLLTSAAP